MIAQLNLENYRSYAKAEIKFGVITGIVGLNNHGKTSIYRALFTLLSNGDFRTKDIRHGTKKSVIEVIFTNGARIKRERTASTQLLLVTTPTGEIKGPYAKVSDMTDLVQQVSGVKPVKLTKGDTNDFIQFVPVDAPQNFLFGGVANETVLKRINNLAGGAGIEVTRGKLMTALKKKKSEAQTTKEAYQESLVEVNKYSEINFEHLSKLQSEIVTTTNQVEKVDTQLTRLDSVVDRITKIDMEGVKKLRKAVDDSGKLYDQAFGLNKELTEIVDKLTQLDQIEYDIAEAVKVGKENFILKKTLKTELAELKARSEEIRVEKVKVQIREDLEFQATTDSICPTCNQPLK